MIGNIVLSLVVAIGAGIGMYIVYGMEKFRAQIGANRLRASIGVGLAAGVASFAIRALGLV
jgi:hypothetical protein